MIFKCRDYFLFLTVSQHLTHILQNSVHNVELINEDNSLSLRESVVSGVETGKQATQEKKWAWFSKYSNLRAILYGHVIYHPNRYTFENESEHSNN